jgi:hypothetical protein
MVNYKIIEEGKLRDQKHKSSRDGFRLFVPVDFSESSYLALAYAMRLAARCKASIELFHAMDTRSLTFSENHPAGGGAAGGLRGSRAARADALDGRANGVAG